MAFLCYSMFIYFTSFTSASPTPFYARNNLLRSVILVQHSIHYTTLSMWSTEKVWSCLHLHSLSPLQFTKRKEWRDHLWNRDENHRTRGSPIARIIFMGVFLFCLGGEVLLRQIPASCPLPPASAGTGARTPPVVLLPPSFRRDMEDSRRGTASPCTPKATGQTMGIHHWEASCLLF